MNFHKTAALAVLAPAMVLFLQLEAVAGTLVL
jgi:hypothetical protein